MAVAGLHPSSLLFVGAGIRSDQIIPVRRSSRQLTRRDSSPVQRRSITVQIPIAAATLEIPRRQPRRSSHVLKIGSPDRSGGCVAQERWAIREALPKTDGWCGSPGMMRAWMGAWMGAAWSGRRCLYQVAAAWIRKWDAKPCSPCSFFRAREAADTASEAFPRGRCLGRSARQVHQQIGVSSSTVRSTQLPRVDRRPGSLRRRTKHSTPRRLG